LVNVDAEPPHGLGVGVFVSAQAAAPSSRSFATNAWHNRLEYILPWVTGSMLALPALLAFYPPMTDLPYHEAAIGILRHFHDATMFPPGLYRLNLGEPNQLFHMVGWLLSYLVSTRWVVKLLVVATIVAIPPCAARLARHIGASPLGALLVAPMTVGWLLYWGLITNLIGLAALMIVLPLLDRFAHAPTGRRTLLATGAVLLLYFAHEGMMFVYAAATMALAVIYPWSRRLTPLRLVPFVFGVGVAVAQAKWQVRFMTPALRSMPLMWDSFRTKLKTIPHIILPANDPVVRIAMLVLCLGTIAGLYWLRTRERRASRGDAIVDATCIERVRSWILAHRWELFAIVCIAAYFVSPLTLNGATFVYHRWFPPGFAVLAIAAAPRNLWIRPARVLRVAIMALPIATLLVAWPSFVDSHRAYAALEPVIEQVEPGSAVTFLDYGPADPTRTFTIGPAAGRILAMRGGRLAYAFTDSSVSPVVIPRRYQWNESLIRIAFDGWAFRPQQDLHRFRYILVRANEPAAAYFAVQTLSPETEYVMRSGEWLLFKSRFPTIPLLSRDSRLEGPPAENIHDRVKAAAKSAGVASSLTEDCPPPPEDLSEAP
jgi:hypothetical protein